jgi:hypothetical protein
VLSRAVFWGMIDVKPGEARRRRKPAQLAVGIEPLRRICDLRDTFTTFALPCRHLHFLGRGGDHSGYIKAPRRVKPSCALRNGSFPWTAHS